MTEEKVQKGKELLEKLNYLKDQKKKWEKATKFSKLEVKGNYFYDSKESLYEVNVHFINFDEIKLLTIARINVRINEVQKEFDEL